MKLRALLLGLTRNEPEDENLEAMKVIKKVAVEEEERQIAERGDP